MKLVKKSECRNPNENREKEIVHDVRAFRTGKYPYLYSQGMTGGQI